MSITADDFFRVDLRIATIQEVHPFPEARKPAYVFFLDLGEQELRKSTAQLTAHYKPEDLIGKQVVVVSNLEPRQVGPHKSECLILGALDEDGQAILLKPDKPMLPGAKVA